MILENLWTKTRVGTGVDRVEERQKQEKVTGRQRGLGCQFSKLFESLGCTEAISNQTTQNRIINESFRDVDFSGRKAGLVHDSCQDRNRESMLVHRAPGSK